MENHAVRCSYWLGVVSAVTALVWRGLNVVGWGAGTVKTLTPSSFLKAGVLFLLMTVAAANYDWIKSRT